MNAKEKINMNNSVKECILKGKYRASTIILQPSRSKWDDDVSNIDYTILIIDGFQKYS